MNSYASEDLIEELKNDISEFGKDVKYWAIFTKIGGQYFITSYDFVLTKSEIDELLEDGEPYPEPIKLEPGEYKEQYTAEKLLELLEKQNSIF